MSSIRNLLSGGQMVAYYPALARAVGGIAPALFLQQIAHWEGYSNDGWVYRTQEELEEELAMTPKVQATCRRHLLQGGFMTEQRRASNRLHYKIEWDKVEEAVQGVPKKITDPTPNNEEVLRDLPNVETPDGNSRPTQPETLDLPNRSFSLNKSKDKSKDKKNTPKGVTPNGVSEEKKHNWFTEFCNRSKELGLLITPEDRKSVPKHLKTLTTKHNASDVEMQRVLTSMLDARLRDWSMSPQQALNKVRGIPSAKRKPKTSTSSIAVIGATEDDYAPESYIGHENEDAYRIEDYR